MIETSKKAFCQKVQHKDEEENYENYCVDCKLLLHAIK